MGKEVSQLNQVLAEEKAIVVFSHESRNEFIKVIKRPKMRKYFTLDKVTSLISLLSHISELIKVTSKVDVCREYKDNFLLELSKDSKADFLITGDNDLLVLEKFENTQIISFSHFINILKA